MSRSDEFGVAPEPPDGPGQPLVESDRRLPPQLPPRQRDVRLAHAGIIDRPGEPPSEISLGFGWFMSLLGTILIAVGGSYRASTTERPRKPPGVM